ncbi:MAG: hypothetical protein IT307_03725, partial [Chloroflexi bacterium]|nr:hypothetical protein [Chloroflexota bacterium]
VAPPTAAVAPPAAPAPTAPGAAAADSALIRPRPGFVDLPGFSIQAQPGFETPLRALFDAQHFWSLNALSQTATRLEWQLMDPQAAGIYIPGQSLISINRRWSRGDPRALAAILEHEAKHVADWIAGVDMRSPRGCVAAEARAFAEEAKTWGELVGARGKPNPRDDLEKSLNWKLSIYQQDPGSIEALIADNSGYQQECRL